MAKYDETIDHSRTTQPRAGEWFKNSRDLLGLLLLAAGVVGLVVCLSAAANGRTQWAIWTGVGAGLALSGGAAWLFVEGQRIMQIGIEPDDDRAVRYEGHWRASEAINQIDQEPQLPEFDDRQRPGGLPMKS